MLSADYMKRVSSFGRAIRACREDKRLSQKELAEALGVGATTITEWENDRQVPVRENLDRLYVILPMLCHAKEPPSRDIPIPAGQRQAEEIAALRRELARIQDKNFHLETELRRREGDA